jgi:predicted outer membrane repeat protein
VTVLPRFSRAIAVAVTLVLAFAAALLGVTPAHAATHTVTKNLDDGSIGTLSYALSNLDAVGGNTVTITTPGPIVMTTGLPTIFDDVAIIGPAGGVTIVMASALGGFVTDAAVVSMQDLDIRSDVPGAGLGLQSLDTDLTLDRVSVREFDLDVFYVGTVATTVSLTDVEVGGLSTATPSTVGAAIQSNGGTVALTRVLSTFTYGIGVLVGSDGAVVDLDTVTAEDAAGGGIDLQATATTITADRVTVTRTAGGFNALLDSSRLDVTALTATDTTGLGASIFATNGSAVTVTGASISGSDDSGISFDAVDSTITASDIESFDNGQVPGCGCGGSGSGIEIYANDSTVALIRAQSHDNPAAEFGGGIYIAEVSNGAKVTVASATIADNQATDDGGGIYVEGVADDGSSLSITDSTITGNTAGDFGGGIYLFDIGEGATSTATVTIARVTVDDNTAAGYGAGIAINEPSEETSGKPTILIDSSTLSNNSTVAGGGGLYVTKYLGVPAVVELRNSTVSTNLAQVGGGVQVEIGGGGTPLTTIIRESTIFANVAHSSGGLEMGGGGVTSVLQVENSIFAGSTSDTNDPDINDLQLQSGAPFSIRYSLVQTPEASVVLPAGVGNIVGVSPQLGALALNGGTTRTHLVTPNTPAYNAGDPAFVGAGLLDQRGQARVFERLDMGAVEWHPALADTGSAPPEPEAPLVALLFLLTGVAMVAFSRLRAVRSVG